MYVIHKPYVDSAWFCAGIGRYDGVFQAFQVPVSCWRLEARWSYIS